MSSILDRFLDAQREFIATSPTEYLALQIARKLSELGHVREYAVLLETFRRRSSSTRSVGRRPEVERTTRDFLPHSEN
jgi:hypothetical protein